jgi:hypothetical protein
MPRPALGQILGLAQYQIIGIAHCLCQCLKQLSVLRKEIKIPLQTKITGK